MKTLLLLILFIPANIFAQKYVGKTTLGTSCSLEVLQKEIYQKITVKRAGGTSYTFNMPNGENYAERTLIQVARKHYAPFIGAPITIFGLGVRTINFNLKEENSKPLSYHLDVNKLFVSGHSCFELKKQ